MRTHLTSGSLVVACALGACVTDDAPTIDDDDPADSLSHDYCYFTSYPVGSKQCVVGPCSVDTSAAVLACTAPGYENYAIGGVIVGAYADGQATGIYLDPTQTFPECRDGQPVAGEPSDPGDYYATGLPVGSPNLDSFCSGSAPELSTAHCYYTSYPVGSHHCITAPCEVTNAATAIRACTVGSGSYINLAIGDAIYGTYQSGQVAAVYLNGATEFPHCIGGAIVEGEPSDPGSYYATGLVVGEASAEQVATFCAADE